MKHGGAGTAYVNYGCGCAECRDANRRRAARRKAQRYAEAKDPNDPRHGTTAFYANYGCRCAECTAANTKKSLEYYQKVKASA